MYTSHTPWDTCSDEAVTCYGLALTVGICLLSGMDCWNCCGCLNFTFFMSFFLPTCICCSIYICSLNIWCYSTVHFLFRLLTDMGCITFASSTAVKVALYSSHVYRTYHSSHYAESSIIFLTEYSVFCVSFFSECNVILSLNSFGNLVFWIFHRSLT